MTAEGLYSASTRHGDSPDVSPGSLNKRQGLYENNRIVAFYVFVTPNKLYYCIASSFVLFGASREERILCCFRFANKEQNASWEAGTFLGSPAMPRVLRNPNLHCHGHQRANTP